MVRRGGGGGDGSDGDVVGPPEACILQQAAQDKRLDKFCFT